MENAILKLLQLCGNHDTTLLNNKFVLMTLEEPVIIVASNVLERICFSLMILKYFL